MAISVRKYAHALPPLQLIILSGVNSFLYWTGHRAYENSFYARKLKIAWRHFNKLELPIIRMLDSYWLPVLISVLLLMYALLIIRPKLKGNRNRWVQIPFYLMTLLQSLLVAFTCVVIYIIFSFEDD